MSTADAVDSLTRQEFCEAVTHVNETPGNELDESVQRRLYGLYSRAVRGIPPDVAPANEHEEQWRAWREAGDLTEMGAMQEYIDLVSRHDPGYLESADDPADQVQSAPVQKVTEAGVADVFTAAREGRCLSRFLPDQKDAIDADGLAI